MSEKQTSRFWHWPDRAIGKRESRRLREEHNQAMNERAELLEALEACVQVFNTERKRIDPTNAFLVIEKALAAIARAKGQP